MCSLEDTRLFVEELFDVLVGFALGVGGWCSVGGYGCLFGGGVCEFGFCVMRVGEEWGLGCGSLSAAGVGICVCVRCLGYCGWWMDFWSGMLGVRGGFEWRGLCGDGDGVGRCRLCIGRGYHLDTDGVGMCAMSRRSSLYS